MEEAGGRTDASICTTDPVEDCPYEAVLLIDRLIPMDRTRAVARQKKKGLEKRL